MSKKILVTFSDEQAAAFEALMAEDLSTNKSAYVAALVGAEVKRRAAATKRTVGRPRKSEAVDASDEGSDYTDDLPKNIPHFGRMIGARELADIEEAQAEFKPRG